MSKERKKIPLLRFPEFIKDGEWSLEELEQCLGYLQPTPYLVQSTNYDEQYETPVLTAGKSFVLGYTDETKGVFKENLPIIIFDDFTTASKFVDFPFKVKSSAIKILLAKNDSNIKFVYESMQILKYEVGVHKRHWISVYSKLKIAIPKPKEQQKIAACLFSLDELVAAHNDKLKALKDHKKGLLQNLFPQEGQKVPKHRFAEFEKDGEWVENKLSDISKLTSSKRVHLADYVNSGIPFFRGKEISELKKGEIPTDVLFISEAQYYEIKNKYGIPKIGDILITAVGTLGNVYRIINDNNFYFKDGNLIWMKEISISSAFLEILLEAKKADVLSTAIGSSQKALTMKALNELIIRVPRTTTEQQKIASCIAAVDELITVQQKNIEELQQHKKGLMQGLFPKIDR